MQEISTKLDETSPDYKVKFTPASIEFDDYGTVSYTHLTLPTILLV